MRLSEILERHQEKAEQARLAYVHQAAVEACGRYQRKIRTAGLLDLTPDVVAAFGEHFYLPACQQRQAGIVDIARKLRDLVKFFVGKGKALWARFKEILGIDSITQLRPHHIKDLAKKGYEALKSALHKAFNKWPLKIYTLEKGKLLGVADIINKMIKKSPRFAAWMSKVRPNVDILDQWLRTYLPGVSHIAMVAIFFWIWINVVEFEWDLSSLGKVLIGQITLGDLLSSLPSSGIGALLNGLGIGMFTLLPVMVVVRIVYMMAHRYLSFEGGRLHLDTEALENDFGLSAEDVR